MRLLIVTNHFYPESFRVNDIAFDRAQRGDEVTVLTGIPDYPEGHFHKGYSLLKKRVEHINGVKVVHVPLIPRGNGSKVRMMLNYSSSIFFFFFYGWYHALFHKYDAVFVHDTSPAFISLPAVTVSKVQKIPLYHWILDMWPESLTAGGIQGGKIYTVILKMMKRIYKRDTELLITSHGSMPLLMERGVPAEKITYLPNWNDDAISAVDESVLPPLPDGFIIMFAGNLGFAQNMENLLAAANELKEVKSIHWVFVGDGRKKPWMDEFVKEHQLEDTVHLLGRYPIETMGAFFKKADVMLVALNDELIFNLVLPAKVQAYMAAGKPILASLCGEGADIIKDANCGWSVPSNEYKALATKVSEIAKLDKEELAVLGQNARYYYEQNFTREKCMTILNASLSKN
ncbi:MAG: glycosyltransferase family 4 protein [Bacteroidales bacterium]|nr:glycosyltransferase family 4 protein [Bacteroidales bacterium]